jgi:hypothetical protein
VRAWSVGVGGSGLFTAVLPGTGGRGLELCLKTGGSAGELIRLSLSCDDVAPLTGLGDCENPTGLLRCWDVSGTGTGEEEAEVKRVVLSVSIHVLLSTSFSATR